MLVGACVAQSAKGKSRTFRKFVYRGIELEKLFDMPPADLVEMYPARIRRRIRRGLGRCVCAPAVAGAARAVECECRGAV